MNSIDWFGLITISMLTIGSLIIGIGWAVLTLFFPQALKEKVMRPPYFPEHHAMMLQFFPQNLMRTTYLIGSISFDFFGERHNGLQIAREIAPPWYRRIVYFVMYAGVINSAISLVLASIWGYVL